MNGRVKNKVLQKRWDSKYENENLTIKQNMTSKKLPYTTVSTSVVKYWIFKNTPYKKTMWDEDLNVF